MTIFGNTSLKINNVSYVHSSTVQDVASNYIFGILLIVIIPPGAVFNILVYLKNHRDSKSPSSIIYRCLAVSDFLVCTIRGLQQVAALLSPDQQLFYDKRSPSILTRIIAVITMASGICMMTVITLLATLRFISLVCPFWTRSHTSAIIRFSLLYIFLTVATSLGITIEYIAHPCAYFASVTQWVVPCKGEKSQLIVDIIFPIVSMLLTTLSSVMTAGFLLKTRISVRSSVTILLMSGGVILWVAMLLGVANILPISYSAMPLFLEKNQYEMYYVYYLIMCFFPILLAVYNSAVVVFRSSDIKEMVWRFVSRIRRHPGDVVSQVTGSTQVNLPNSR